MARKEKFLTFVDILSRGDGKGGGNGLFDAWVQSSGKHGEDIAYAKKLSKKSMDKAIRHLLFCIEVDAYEQVSEQDLPLDAATRFFSDAGFELGTAARKAITSQA